MTAGAAGVRALGREVRRLRRDRRAGAAVVISLSMTVIVGMVGLGLDMGRLYAVRSQLQTAVDATALAAAKQISATTRDADAAKLFGADFYLDPTTTTGSGTTTTTGYLGSLVPSQVKDANGVSRPNPQITQLDSSNVQVTATATVPMTLMSIFGTKALDVQATATSQRQSTGMELALVLDTTGSMRGDKIIGLRNSATSMVNLLYGTSVSGQPNDTLPNFWVSVVPYATAVNMGPLNLTWLTAGSYNPLSFAPQGWRGCMEARTGKNGAGVTMDQTEDPPTVAGFSPFLWKSTKGQFGNNQGDNDWTASTVTDTAPQTSYWASGPNLNCPFVPVLPLTASRTTVVNTIAQLTAPFSGGTISTVGLQAGWFTLSPLWKGLWGNATLPLPYNTTNMQKVLVLMTDGQNEWDGSWAPSTVRVDGFYTAYGRLSENRLGITVSNTGRLSYDEQVTQDNAVAEIDKRMLALCTAIKNKGVVVYTIGFDVPAGSMSSNIKTLLSNCASKPENFFYSTSTTALQAAFTQIGSQLASLRLTK